MTRPADQLDRARAAATAGRTADASALLRGVIASTAPPEIHFDALLLLAAIVGAEPAGAPESVTLYEQAARLARDARLPRAGEADLGLSVALGDADRPGEARAALGRAAQAFRTRGHAYLRGCAEVLRACASLDAHDGAAADRHLDLAADLLATTDDPRMESVLHVVRAEVRAEAGDVAAARLELSLAAGTALRLDDESLREELRARRHAVRRALVDALAPPSED